MLLQKNKTFSVRKQTLLGPEDVENRIQKEEKAHLKWKVKSVRKWYTHATVAQVRVRLA